MRRDHLNFPFRPVGNGSFSPIGAGKFVGVDDEWEEINV